jgi:type III secretion protein SpaR/YscT/HrcT
VQALVDLFERDMISMQADWVLAATLIFVRIITFLHVCPIFGHKSFSSLSRIALGILLTAVSLDVLEYQKVPLEGFSLTFVLFQNVVLGFLIGFLVSLAFATITAGGEMMDSSMGFSSGQIFNPSTGSQTTIMGNFMNIFTIVVFFAIGGPEMLLEGLFKSFHSFPLYEMNLSFNVDKFIHLTGEVISMGFILVSPIVLTILINDLVLGLISRASPQINAFQISFTIKPTIGVIMFLITLPLFMSSLANFLSSPSRFF